MILTTVQYDNTTYFVSFLKHKNNFNYSCNIYISDRQTGLYVVNFDGCIGADPLDPMPPSEVIGFSDYLTPESISISWVNPELLYDGTPLTSFSVSISRNETFIAEIVDESNE